MRVPSSIHRCYGFSLVEVTLAVSIAALALITLLGLLPQGLEISRKTSVIASNSNIVEQLIRDLESTQWDAFPSGKVKKYFNDQGSPVSAESDNISFVAEMDFTKQSSLPQTGIDQLYLRRVIIHVAASGSPSFTFGENNRLSYHTYNHLIAKSR